MPKPINSANLTNKLKLTTTFILNVASEITGDSKELQALLAQCKKALSNNLDTLTERNAQMISAKPILSDEQKNVRQFTSVVARNTKDRREKLNLTQHELSPFIEQRQATANLTSEQIKQLQSTSQKLSGTITSAYQANEAINQLSKDVSKIVLIQGIIRSENAAEYLKQAKVSIDAKLDALTQHNQKLNSAKKTLKTIDSQLQDRRPPKMGR